MNHSRKKVNVRVLLLLLFVVSFCSNSNQPNTNANQQNEAHISKLHTLIKSDSKTVKSTSNEKMARLSKQEREWLTGHCYIQLGDCSNVKDAISEIDNVDLVLKFHHSVSVYKIIEILDLLLLNSSAQFNSNYRTTFINSKVDAMRRDLPFPTPNLLKSTTFTKNDKSEENKSSELHSENTCSNYLSSKSSKNIILKGFENQTNQERLTLTILQVLPNTIEKLGITTGICIDENSNEVKGKILANLTNLQEITFNNCDQFAIVTSPDKTFEFLAEIKSLKSIYFSSTEWFNAFLSFTCNFIKSNEKSCILKYYSSINIHFVTLNLHDMKYAGKISQENLEIYEKYSMKRIITFVKISSTSNLNPSCSVPTEVHDTDEEKVNFIKN